MRRIAKRFTKGFDEVKLKEGKRDHSGEELFVNELSLPTHMLPVEELREYHLNRPDGRKHDPSLMSSTADLASTLEDFRTEEEEPFRNTGFTVKT